jgi:integrase
MGNGTCHCLRKSIALERRSDFPKPRMHALRHRFAVRSLAHCHGTPDDVARHTLALSTYLGHAPVTDTYWSLHATPQRMRHIADACAAHEGGDAP